MTGTAKAGSAGQRRAVFAVDEDAALVRWPRTFTGSVMLL